MGKYGEVLGQWEINIGRDEEQGALIIRPKKGDNLRLGKILTQAKEKDKGWLLEQINTFLIDLVARDHKPDGNEEKEELEFYIESNLINLMNELLIAFRWTTREEMEKGQNQLLKNLNPQQTTS